MEYNLFKKTKGFFFFFFNISNLKAGTGGGEGGYINESLYRESKD